VEKLRERRVVRGRDLLILVVPIYKGIGCYLDDTVVVYGRESRSRLGWFNADPKSPELARHLNGLDMGDADANGTRLIASGWTTSNCTSTWNGKAIRIDRLTPSGVENVLARGVSAQDREPAENVSASVRLNVVTFFYQGALGDMEMLSGDSIARYRVDGDHASREAPIALSRAGFLHEWLEMDEAEAARWSTPEALRDHARIAKVFREGFDWERIAVCAGSPRVWEIAVRTGQHRSYGFRMTGERATELRMVAVDDRQSTGCRVFDIKKSLASVGLELPW